MKKINQVFKSWPKGTVADHAFLSQLGVSYQLAEKYLRGGWITSIGHSAFKRADDEKVEWPGALYTIQKFEKPSVHIGGKTALELLGYAHYVPMSNKQSVWLFSNVDDTLPAWFKKHDWNVEIKHFKTNLLVNVQEGIAEKEVSGIPVKISSPERALIEYLYLVPKKASLEEAQQLMEGLSTLRPDVVQKLLEECRSIKVKRLFLFLSEHNNHPWVKHLDLSKVNLGQGKRAVAKDGYLDIKYNITVPLSFKK